MAISSSVCDSYAAEILSGIHSASDTYKMALYQPGATLGAATTVYSATNEVANGSGYTTSGQILGGFNVVLIDGKAVLDFSDLSWEGASFSAAGALIYNSTKGNKAVATLDFGGTLVSTGGTFFVTIPPPTSSAGLIRI